MFFSEKFSYKSTIENFHIFTSAHVRMSAPGCSGQRGWCPINRTLDVNLSYPRNSRSRMPTVANLVFTLYQAARVGARRDMAKPDVAWEWAK